MSIIQKTIYVLGNGFDLSADLPTRYTDFMLFINWWRTFYDEYAFYSNTKAPASFLSCPKNGKLTKSDLMEYAKSREIFDEDNIEKLDDIISENIWINYFQQCEYVKPGWAGFEKEIKEALIVVDKFFNTGISIYANSRSSHEKAIYEMIKSVYTSRNAFESFRKCIDNHYHEQVASFKKEFISIITKELLEFTEAFRLYLTEFVERMKVDAEHSIVVNNPENTYIISLNYTHNQIGKMGLEKTHIHYIHGSDRIPNNLVMGIENDESISNEYIRFKKFFQRIQKKTGAEYKYFFDDAAHGVHTTFLYNVVFYGHSLDPIDSDFIHDIFKLKKGRVIIHYCNQEDYEQKVINCVELFGADYVINAVANNEIVFSDYDLHSISLM